MKSIKWNYVYGYPADPWAMFRGVEGIARYGANTTWPPSRGNEMWSGNAVHTDMWHVTGASLHYSGRTCRWMFRDGRGREMILPTVYAGGGRHMTAWRMAEAIVRHGWPT